MRWPHLGAYGAAVTWEREQDRLKEGRSKDASKQQTNWASALGAHVDLGGCCRSRLRGDAFVVEGACRLRPGDDTHRAELRRIVRFQLLGPNRSDLPVSPHL